MTGKFTNITTLQQLRDMDCWTADTPLRVVTGYHAIAKRFFEQNGFEHVALLTADGALEASPAMGCADIILDLVSTGMTVILMPRIQFWVAECCITASVTSALQQQQMSSMGWADIILELVLTGIWRYGDMAIWRYAVMYSLV